MSLSDADIVELWRDRKSTMGPMFGRMSQIRNLNNGDLVLPLPEVDKVEKAAVANLIQQGIDQLGSRIASVQPDVQCPSVNPGQALADKKARKRRQAILGWWDHSMNDILDGRRARHLIAYASSPMQIRPGHSKDKPVPTWHLRSPLQTYPGPRPNPDDMCPDDCIFNYQVTLKFLQRRYPDVMHELEKGQNPKPDDKYDILEYMDKDELVMLVVGATPAASYGYGAPRAAGSAQANIYRIPNRAGICPVAIPKRTTLDIPIGQFDGMGGMYQAQAQLMALSLIAVRRAVFVKEWLVGRPGEMPEVLTEAMPEQGKTGVVVGGTLEDVPVAPPQAALSLAQTLAQEQRQQGGLPSEFGGQSETNVRTGRRGADIMSAQIDFPIQEAQRLLARSKERENEVAIAISKNYFGNKTVSFYVRKMKGDRGSVSYTPNDIFETDVNFVDYGIAGSDANQLTVRVGQLLSLKAMSLDTARRRLPDIDDPEFEREHVVAEALDDALLGSIAQAVQGQQLGPVDIAHLKMYIERDGMDLEDAVQKVHDDEQKRQSQAPPTPAAAAPGIAAGPGQPAGAAVPPGQQGPGPTPPTPEGLAQLLGSLHAPPGQTAGNVPG